VTSPASVGRDERLRLFLALQLPSGVIAALAGWQARELRAGRVVPPGNLHITLAFLGGRPAGELPAVLRALEESAAEAGPATLEVVRWRETRSVGMLELRDAGGDSVRLAERLHERLAALAVYRPEARPWLPHVTVLRFRERPRLSPPVPELAWMSSDAAAFLSRLHPSGARYEVLKSFPLGGR
jgi:2'-5' RNA ligase